jgi:hypothetical protein
MRCHLAINNPTQSSGSLVQVLLFGGGLRILVYRLLVDFFFPNMGVSWID